MNFHRNPISELAKAYKTENLLWSEFADFCRFWLDRYSSLNQSPNDTVCPSVTHYPPNLLTLSLVRYLAKNFCWSLEARSLCKRCFCFFILASSSFRLLKAVNTASAYYKDKVVIVDGRRTHFRCCFPFLKGGNSAFIAAIATCYKNENWWLEQLRAEWAKKRENRI